MAVSNLPNLWNLTTIGNVADVVMGQSPPSETYNTNGIGLPFFQGKAEFGVESPTVTKWCPSPTRIADIGDILLSVRAPVGPTNLANQHCGIGRGLAAIRAIPELADPTYLLYYFRFIEPELVSLGSGSTFSAVNRRDIETFRIPLPPLVEQQRISNILRQADILIQWRSGTNEKTKFLQNALFQKMFGDPDRNLKEWKTKKLGAVGELDRGRSRNRPRDAAHLYGGKYPFIQTGDIANSEGWITEYRQTYSEAGLAQSRLWKKGTLCITIAANIAKTGILTFDACFPDSVVGFTAGEDVKVEYVRQWFEMIQGRLEVAAPQLAQKNINLQILRDLEIPIPPLELQEKYIKALTEIRAITETQKTSIDKLKLLFQSISGRAFAGELTSNWRDGQKTELQRSIIERDKKLGINKEVGVEVDAFEKHFSPEDENSFFEELASTIAATIELVRNSIRIVVSQDEQIASLASLLMENEKFSVAIKKAKQDSNQDMVEQSIQDSITKLDPSLLNRLSRVFQYITTSSSLSHAADVSINKYACVVVEHILAHINYTIEKLEIERGFRDIQLSPMQEVIFEKIRTHSGYFGAESLSENYDIPLHDVRDALESFQTLGLVMQVSVTDEDNSTPEFAIFAPTYRAIRFADDSRHNDLRALGPNLEEPTQ